MRLPDGSPAAGVPVKVDVQESSEKSLQVNTDQEGTVFPVFNIQAASQITVKVSIPKLRSRCYQIWFCSVLTVFTSGSNR